MLLCHLCVPLIIYRNNHIIIIFFPHCQPIKLSVRHHHRKIQSIYLRKTIKSKPQVLPTHNLILPFFISNLILIFSTLFSTHLCQQKYNNFYIIVFTLVIKMSSYDYNYHIIIFLFSVALFYENQSNQKFLIILFFRSTTAVYCAVR